MTNFFMVIIFLLSIFMQFKIYKLEEQNKILLTKKTLLKQKDIFIKKIIANKIDSNNMKYLGFSEILCNAKKLKIAHYYVSEYNLGVFLWKIKDDNNKHSSSDYIGIQPSTLCSRFKKGYFLIGLL